MRVTNSMVGSVFGAALAAMATACSSGAATSPGERVLGEYVATSAGSIARITFADSTHYSWVLRNCTQGEESCTARGTYRLDSTYDSVSFTNQATGTTSVLPFKAETEGPSPVLQGAPLHVLGGISLSGGASDAGDAGGTSLTSGDATTLTSGDAGLTSGTAVQLVYSFQLGGESFTSNSGDASVAEGGTGGPDGGVGDAGAGGEGGDAASTGIGQAYCSMEFPSSMPFQQADGGACPAFDPSACVRNWGWGDAGSPSPTGGSCCLGHQEDIKSAGAECAQALEITDYTACENLLFLQCINDQAICTGGITWVTAASNLGSIPPRVTDQEWCYEHACQGSPCPLN